MNTTLDQVEEVLDTQEEIPDQPIGCFHITRRDYKKAKKVRKMLAVDAPGIAGTAILNTPIKAAPRVRKNRMYAITTAGEPILEINLKTGQISFVGAQYD